MLEIAGGILIALLALVFLPQLVVGTLYSLVALVCVIALWIFYYAVTHGTLEQWAVCGAMGAYLLVYFYISRHFKRIALKAERIEEVERERIAYLNRSEYRKRKDLKAARMEEIERERNAAKKKINLS